MKRPLLLPLFLTSIDVAGNMSSSAKSNLSKVVITNAGVTMPRLIYGTAWKAGSTCDLVVQAIRSGFRGVDTACQPKHYNEAGVGAALAKLAKEDGIERKSLFIQTKFTSLNGQDPKNIPYDKKAPLEEQGRRSGEENEDVINNNYASDRSLHPEIMYRAYSIFSFLFTLLSTSYPVPRFTSSFSLCLSPLQWHSRSRERKKTCRLIMWTRSCCTGR